MPSPAINPWFPIKVAIVIIFFSIGLTIGYFIPRDVHVQVIEASGKYVNYFKIIHDNLYPFNETDNVTIFIHGNKMLINHTVPNDVGIPHFEIGFDNDGYITYITERRN